MFPALSPEMAHHCEQVTQALHRAIEAGEGWLAFDDYLRIVQYAPGLGYYSAGSEKFGSAGDFVTAPELSGLFGRCVARQCAQILHTGGDVLELGAGSGTLAASLLSSLQEQECLPRHYYILEVSADLRARQQQRLDDLPPELRQRIQWLDTLPASPIVGVVVANEVADALPFKRFVVHSDAVFERGIALSGEKQLAVADRAADPTLRAEIERVMPQAPGEQTLDEYESELCVMTEAWIASLGGALARGALLLIDYGCSRRDYFHPQRTRGTMRCHFRHRAHDDALLYPGLQDISAWVDFTRVAEGASAADLQVSGYCTQTAFLLANGIEQELANVTQPLEHAKLAAQARVLLLPGEMGENFKVMALTRELEAPLRGFAYQDLRDSL
jgi:SAM-dependent MidA family methyltransferase